MSTIFENVRSITMLPTPTEAILQYQAVEVVAAGTVQAAGAASEAVVGFALESSPDSDVTGVDPKQASAAIPVAILDGAKFPAIAGANNLAPGNVLTTNASGQVVVAAAGEPVVGIALEASTAIGDWIQIAGVRGSKV
jgi:hypothetical protein